jgi:putative heme-binding domain-containing protein
MDFQDPVMRGKAMQDLLAHCETQAAASGKLAGIVLLEAAARTPGFSKAILPTMYDRTVAALAELPDDAAFVRWADRLRIEEADERLFQITLANADRNTAASAMRTLLEFGEAERVKQLLRSGEEPQQLNLVRSLADSNRPEAESLLRNAWQNASLNMFVRSEITKALGRWPAGQSFLLQQVTSDNIPEDLRFPVANVLLTSDDEQIRSKASEYLSLPGSADQAALPPLSELVQLPGDPQRGEQIFVEAGTCAKCHRVRGAGTEVGPDLSAVGGKLSIEALFESVLNPSAGISHNYEMYKITLVDGRTLSGVVLSKTEQELVLKDKEAVEYRLAAFEVEEMMRQQKSLMPEDLQKNLTQQQLVDLIAYLQTLKE